MAEVKQFLEKVELDQYAGDLIKNGYDTMDILFLMGRDELEGQGVKPGHALKLIDAMNKESAKATKGDTFVYEEQHAIKQKDVIKSMAEASKADPKAQIDVIPAGEIFGLTHPICAPEDQMFQLFMTAPMSYAYNNPFVVNLTCPIDSGLVLTGVTIFTERHDTTRTSYHMEGGTKALRRIHSKFQGDAHVLHMDGAAQLDPLRQMDWVRPFQLGVSGARVQIYYPNNDRQKSSGENCPWITMTMHHIVSDGDCGAIAWSELDMICSFLFRGFSVEAVRKMMHQFLPVEVQYHDYAYWMTSLDATGRIKDELALWFAQITSSSPPEVLDIPLDRPRGRTFQIVGTGITIALPQDVLDPIGTVNPTSSYTPYTMCFTFYSVALCRMTMKSDVHVAIAYGTRPLPVLNTLIGTFVNLIPTRYSHYSSEPFGATLDRMGMWQLAAMKHSLSPFLTIADYVRPYNNPQADPARNPVYQSMLDLVTGGDEFTPPGMPGILDYFGLVNAPGGQVQYMQSCYNSSLTTRQMAATFLNQLKSCALFASKCAAVGYMALATTPIPVNLQSPEIGISTTQGANMGTFTFKLNLKNEKHDDVQDEDCEISILSGPEPEGVPDEYDFFRRSKRFLRQSGIMPTADVSHAYAPQWQQPPKVKAKRGVALVLPTPQSTETDPDYKEIYSEPQLNWAPTAPLAKPTSEVLMGEIKSFNLKAQLGIITPADGSGDVVFTPSSIPAYCRPHKKNPVDLTGRHVCFTLVHGIQDRYAAGLNFLWSESQPSEMVEG